MNQRRDERLGELLARHVPTASTAPEFTALLWEQIEASGKVRRGRAAPLWRRRPLLAAAIVAGVASIVLAVSLFGGNDPAVRQPVLEPLFMLGGPADASAAEVVLQARKALATVRAIRARWEWTSASVDIPYDDLPKDASVDEILDRATVGGLMPYYATDITVTADGRSRHVTDVSYELSGEEENGEVTVHRAKGQAEDGVAPQDIEIADERAGTFLFYGPEMTYPNSWRAETAESDSGYAAGPPDANLSSLLPFGPSPSAFSVFENGEVRESTFEGRPALTIVAPVRPGPIEITYDDEGRFSSAGTSLTVDEIELTVDVASSLPVRMASYLRGHLVEIWRLRDLQVDVEVPESDFAFDFRDGAPIEGTDFGFRDTDLDAVEAKVGYAPLVPKYVPAHFRRNLVRCAAGTPTWVVFPIGDDSSQSREFTSRDVTSIGYRAGFLHLTVTMRPTKGLPAAWLKDPFAEDPSMAGATAAPERVRLTSGALTGSRARIAMPPLGIPHLWVVSDGMLVTVAGDASRAQLLRVAESLQPYRSAD